MPQDYFSIAKGFLPLTPQELEANRQGQITADQLNRAKALFLNELKLQKTVLLGMQFFFLVIFLGIYFFDPSFQELIKQWISEAFWIFVLVIGSFILIPILFIFCLRSKENQFFQSCTVLKVTGSLKKYSLGEDYGFALEIEKKKFIIPEASFYESFQVDKNYSFYYLPFSNYNLLLSWEKT